MSVSVNPAATSRWATTKLELSCSEFKQGFTTFLGDSLTNVGSPNQTERKACIYLGQMRE